MFGVVPTLEFDEEFGVVLNLFEGEFGVVPKLQFDEESVVVLSFFEVALLFCVVQQLNHLSSSQSLYAVLAS